MRFCFDSPGDCDCHSVKQIFSPSTIMSLLRISQIWSGLAVAALLTTASAFAAPEIPDECKVGGIAIGSQAYSFNRFTVFEAIEKTEQTGGKTIEFYPGQKLSKEKPDIKWDHNTPDEIIAQVQEKLAKHKIKAVNYGVVVIPPDESAARKIFEFARKLGLYGITTESDKSIDVIEKMVKEYDIRVGFHEHRRQPNNPNYKVWDPNYVLALVKDRDPRIGACADTGHWQTSGLNALDSVKLLRGRLVSLHLKERAALGDGQHDLIYGLGNSNIRGIIEELKSQGFAGHISIEYEFNWDNSVPDIAQCIGYVRALGAK